MESSSQISPSFWAADRPSILWLLVAGGIAIFLIMTENKSQNCRDRECLHSVALPEARKRPTEQLDQIVDMLRLNHTTVSWRRTMLVAIVIGLVLVFLFYPCFPHGMVFLFTAALIFTGLYIGVAWQDRLWDRYDRQVETRLLHLRTQLECR